MKCRFCGRPVGEDGKCQCRKCHWVKYQYADGQERVVHAECRTRKMEDVINESYGKTLHSAPLVGMVCFMHIIGQQP